MASFIGGGIGLYLMSLLFRYFVIGRGGSKGQHIGMVWFIALWTAFFAITGSIHRPMTALSAVAAAFIITVFLSWKYVPDDTAPQRTATQIVLRTIFVFIGLLLAMLLLAVLLTHF